eukprot:GFUD01032299.1.p1 GENE.GFUD01032299.1~~GFUD01032299.1.p1  ORF type:complete len:554 (+),score=169.48 GFUD01032299.1:109-1770(+)
MSPTTSISSTSTPVARSRLTKNKRKPGIIKPAPITISSSSGPASSTPSLLPTGPTVTASSMFPPPSLPTRREVPNVSASPVYYRNYEAMTSSPFHIPNSQAPIPGREVFWDLDTPQSKKYREALAKEFEESDSPLAKQREVTPKMRMVARSRIDTLTSTEEDRKGEEAMQDLLDLCKVADEKLEQVENVEPVKLEMENLSMERDEKCNDEAEDMFADDIDLGDTMDFGVHEECKTGLDSSVKDNCEILDTAIDNDLFNDDDESFLLQATQAAEMDKVMKVEPVNNDLLLKFPEKETVVATNPKASVKQVPVMSTGIVKNEKTFHKPVQKDPVKLKIEPVMTHPAISRMQEQGDGFGSEDDSFDELLSQMDDPLEMEDSPASPILKKKRKCFDLSIPAPTQPHLPLSELNRLPGTSTNSRSGTSAHIKSGSGTFSHTKPGTGSSTHTKPGTSTYSRPAGGTIRKFSSFDSQEEKKIFPRMKSDPNIGQVILPGTSGVKDQSAARAGNMMNTVMAPVKLVSSKPVTRSSCSKEDIDRKRKEAMARRQQSQSQARR